ncbi:putative glycosyl hydrolases family 16 [Lyophyllum shimeji]|uniref:Glycosyl hydrolases family 16 n=1 Tax=Lyophyllum shimeji TaxID=47721 RepID=A0A9P3PU76_LYOSH|nr:putative glycosyl hydrolases family 16 [Lyophyllum shimeji]
MFLLITFLLSCTCLCAVAGDAQTPPFHRSWTRPSRILQNRNAGNFSKTFTLTDMYTGTGFLNGWDFFTGADPTQGSVRYLSKAEATAKGLAFVQKDGTTVLAVDDKNFLPIGAPRDSVRISTKKQYNGGLFIADFFAMPHGCSVWPAYWSLGPVWPQDGEIDILEGVHNQPTNQYTVHTSAGCTLSTGNVQVASKVLGKQCASSANSNTGCGFLDTDTRTYGRGFNLVAGGVYAHLWNGDGIKVWHFARNEIPNDIKNKAPNPSSWGPPVAFWSSSSCDMASHFRDHKLVLDTTLCGQFGGATFSKDGCPGSCAQAVTDPNNYKFAKWKLNYIAVYQ